MPSDFDKLTALYKNTAQIINIITLVIALIALGISIWLSRKEGPRRTWMAILFSVIYPGLGHIYIRQYAIGGIYIIAMIAIIGLKTPIFYLHYLLALSYALRYIGFWTLALILFVWLHSIWFVNRMIQNQKRMDFMTAMYKGLHEDISEKKKVK